MKESFERQLIEFESLKEECVAVEEDISDLLSRCESDEEAKDIAERLFLTAQNFAEYGFCEILELCLPQCVKCSKPMDIRIFDNIFVCQNCGERYRVTFEGGRGLVVNIKAQSAKLQISFRVEVS